VEPMNRIAQARKDAGLSSKKLAEMMDVDTTTLSNWESGRRQLTLERLKQLAELLGISVTYLLGLDEQVPNLSPVEKSKLPMLHRMPVWTKNYGWGLVNSIENTLVFTDKSDISIETIQEPLYLVPPLFSLSLRGIGALLSLNEIKSSNIIWVEPITTDYDLAAELRGWYKPRGRRLVENEYGNRFYLHTYGAKWLAFKSCLNNNGDEDE